MRDVAKLADVSQRTVSNVVNDYRYVKPETRARVQRAIETLRYRPNVSAQKLRHGRTGVVGLAVPDISAAYFAELADHIQRQATQRGITLLIDQTGGMRDRETLVIDAYQNNLIDGLILSPQAIIPSELTSLELTFPTVWLGESIDHAGVPHVSIDNVAAALEVTNHLLDTGRRTIAALGTMPNPDEPGPGQRRLRGYTSALQEAGVAFDLRLVLTEPIWTMPSGQNAVDRIREGSTNVDAIFCFNDALALGVLRGLHQHGIRVPDDIAVVGWDDIEPAAFTTPTLTTIAPDKGEIAQLAIDHLLSQLAGIPIQNTEVTAGHRLVIRESSESR